MVRIFVGSSTEQSNLALDVCSWIEKAGCQPMQWSDTFRPGDTILHRLFDLSCEVDAAILIFGEDDQTWYREQLRMSPRDNVILEYGLFTGSLGGPRERRAIIIRVDKASVASDIGGIVFENYTKTRSKTVERAIIDWAKSIEPRHSLAAGFGTKRYAQSKKVLFEQGSKLIMNASKRVRLCARTPVPIMGARPYEDSKARKHVYEDQQFEEYWKITERAAKQEIECDIISSIACLQQEMLGKGEVYKNEVKERISKLYSRQEQSKGSLSLYWTKDFTPLTFVVVDQTSLVWFKGNNSDNVWISDQSDELSDALNSVRWLVLDQDEVIKSVFG